MLIHLYYLFAVVTVNGLLARRLLISFSLFALIFCVSCSKKLVSHTQVAKPSSAITNVIEALNTQDSVKLLNTFSLATYKVLSEKPANFSKAFQVLKNTTLHATIISEAVDQQVPTLGRVKSVIYTKGEITTTIDTIDIPVYFEDGNWKQDEIFPTIYYYLTAEHIKKELK